MKMARDAMVDARLRLAQRDRGTYDMRMQSATLIGIQMRRLQSRYARWAKNVWVKLIVTAAVSGFQLGLRTVDEWQP